MSGIAGSLATDGSEVDRQVLEQMADFLSVRGPDGKGIRTDGAVGLVHTLLATNSRKPAAQPFTLDGSSWIIADARIDGRAELARQLEIGDPIEFTVISDAELILRAWEKWGAECPDYLLGDFAFIIWDGRDRRLFGARDHFGVKPLYYSETSSTLYVSNTIDCLRRCPGVSTDLDELFVAEFLMFGQYLTRHLSVFKGIHRLPPGHRLTWSDRTGTVVERYWSLPVHDQIRFRDPADYPARFRELMEEAVRDRVPDDRICLIMSGGLDSTTVAAFARSIMPARRDGESVRACTFVYEQLFEDDEGDFAGDVTDTLGIPSVKVPADREEVNWQQGGRVTPEPSAELGIDHGVRSALELFEGWRVGLTGHGGDLALHPAPSSGIRFLQAFFFGGLGREMFRYRRRHGHLPRIGIRQSFREGSLRRRPGLKSAPPPWLDRDLSDRLDLEDRWRDFTETRSSSADTLRSVAHKLLEDPLWPSMFEEFDPGRTGVDTELRHPWFDLRLVTFLLSLPPVPWCVEKMIVRQAMIDRLPASVLNRPKTPLRGYSGYEILSQEGVPGLDELSGVEGLDRFIDVSRYGIIARQPHRLRPEEYDLITRPLGLARWLRQSPPERFRTSQEQ